MVQCTGAAVESSSYSLNDRLADLVIVRLENPPTNKITSSAELIECITNHAWNTRKGKKEQE